MRYHHPPTTVGYPIEQEIDQMKRNHYKRRKKEQAESTNYMEPGNNFMCPKDDSIETGWYWMSLYLHILSILAILAIYRYAHTLVLVVAAES